MSADFTPNKNTVTILKPFRFWCQKVLPLVYDDSLSYYELLCKVVDYLNKTMEDVDLLSEDVNNMFTAFNQLQTYVNNYFDNLDVQEEINNKLDIMAEDGSLSALIQPLFDDYKEDIDEEIENQNTVLNQQNGRITVLESRMDTFASLPDGSTSGDAELLDIRTGYNGTVYPSAGDAVRGQVGDLNNSIGTWYYTKTMTSQFPYILISGVFSKVYFKLLEPTNATLVTIFGMANGQQTELYRNTKTEFVAELGNVSSYDALKYTINLPASATVAYRAIIHGFDDHSISQAILNIDDKIGEINDELTDLYVPTEKINGTNYAQFYITNGSKLATISNNTFNIRSYPVTAGKVYYLYGKNVALAGSLPLCGFGTDAVADNVTVKEIILTATTTHTDYEARYAPTENGYLYVAWVDVDDVDELQIYDTELVSNTVIDRNWVKRDIKIQLFGDSITDNQWGDGITWANFIEDNMPDYNVTVVNDAVAGSGINGHGKATTSSTSHQNDEYNFVYDLVTDGVTLQTNADAIVILAGTNNWASSTPVGDMSSTGYSTIYAALKGILEYISQHSAAMVFVCTIPQRYNTVDQSKPTNAYGEPLDNNGVSLADYCEPYRKLSAFYGMPCIDLNEALGWNRINILNFSNDGLHPNKKGDKMLAEFICSKIKEHIVNAG